MADTGERDVRDRLGELLRRNRGLVDPWGGLADDLRETYREKADALLVDAPTVGLRIGRVEE